MSSEKTAAEEALIVAAIAWKAAGDRYDAAGTAVDVADPSSAEAAEYNAAFDAFDEAEGVLMNAAEVVQGERGHE